MTTSQSLEAAYIEHRVARRTATTLDERQAAEKAAAAVVRKARRQGVTLDEIGLDEQARLQYLASR